MTPHALFQVTFAVTRRQDILEAGLVFQAPPKGIQNRPHLLPAPPQAAVLLGSGQGLRMLAPVATSVSLVTALLRAGCHRDWLKSPGPGCGGGGRPQGPCAWRRARGGQGYSLLLGLVNAAPEVGDL